MGWSLQAIVAAMPSQVQMEPVAMAVGEVSLAATDCKSASCRASRIVFEMHWQCSANNTKVPDKGPLSSGQSTLCCGEGVRQPDCIRLEKAETKHNHQQS